MKKVEKDAKANGGKRLQNSCEGVKCATGCKKVVKAK